MSGVSPDLTPEFGVQPGRRDSSEMDRFKLPGHRIKIQRGACHASKANRVVEPSVSAHAVPAVVSQVK